MYIRKKKGVYKDKIYINYQLVESVRTPNGPRQKVICSLGNLKGRTQKEWLELARKVESVLSRQPVTTESNAATIGLLGEPTHDLSFNCGDSRFEKL